MSEIDARCPINLTPSRGQRSHVASLHAQDVVNVDSAVPFDVKRIWIVNQAPAAPVGWKQVLEWTFRDGQTPNGGTVTLALYLRNGS